jgi:hypothetical protein
MPVVHRGVLRSGRRRNASKSVWIVTRFGELLDEMTLTRGQVSISDAMGRDFGEPGRSSRPCIILRNARRKLRDSFHKKPLLRKNAWILGPFSDMLVNKDESRRLPAPLSFFLVFAHGSFARLWGDAS